MASKPIANMPSFPPTFMLHALTISSSLTFHSVYTWQRVMKHPPVNTSLLQIELIGVWISDYNVSHSAESAGARRLQFYLLTVSIVMYRKSFLVIDII